MIGGGEREISATNAYLFFYELIFGGWLVGWLPLAVFSFFFSMPMTNAAARDTRKKVSSSRVPRQIT